MNLLLFEPREVGQALPRADRRAEHLLTVLKRSVGDTFDAGVIDGSRGKGTISQITPEEIRWRFEPGSAGPAALDPVELWVGLPRPQTARKILQEGAALGVQAMRFVVSDKTEAGYARSTLWTSGEWRRHALAGVEQSFATTLPEVEFGRSLAETLARGGGKTLIALDNYEAPADLGDPRVGVGAPAVLLVGSERGWSAAERDLLRAHRAVLAHLGPRILRTETACVAALTLIQARWRALSPTR